MWFKDLMGFNEEGHDNVQNNIELGNDYLLSKVNNRKYQFGNLELVSVKELRDKVSANKKGDNKLIISECVGDVKLLHADIDNENAVFQAASQFNLLEMVQPNVTPENGVAIYENDLTQGPACAIACGAGTIYRNYFVDIHGRKGQTVNNQIDCLEDIGEDLNNEELMLWQMENGYALPSILGLKHINNHIENLSIVQYDELLIKLKVGIQWDTEVTISDTRHTVNQIYCSALPVSYSHIDADLFEPFATLILEATYEAAILTAIHNMQRCGNNKLYLTLVGGGAFGNNKAWIFGAIRKSVMKYKDFPLDINIVSYGRSNLHIESVCDSLINDING